MPISWSVDGNGQVNISFTADYSIEEAERVMKEVYIVGAVTFWQLHIKDMWDARVAVVTATARQEDMARMSDQSAA